MKNIHLWYNTTATYFTITNMLKIYIICKIVETSYIVTKRQFKSKTYQK